MDGPVKDDTLDLAVAAFKDRLARESHLPDELRWREAMRSAIHVATARSPGVMRYIEGEREATIVDELVVRRLRERARPIIDAVVAEANAGGADITADLLTGSCPWPWLVIWRDRACWLLSRDGWTTADIGAAVGGRTHQAVSKAVRRYAARMAAAVAVKISQRGETR